MLPHSIGEPLWIFIMCLYLDGKLFSAPLKLQTRNAKQLTNKECVREGPRRFLHARGKLESLPVSVRGVYVVCETQTHTKVRRGVGLRRSSPVLGHTVSRGWKPVIKDASRQSSNQREREGVSKGEEKEEGMKETEP